MLSDEELAAIRDHYVATKERDAPHRLGFVDGGFVDSIFDHIAALQAEADAAKRDVERMREALREAVRLYSDFGLIANDAACGRWINSARAALSPQETPRDASEDGSNQASEE